MEARLAEKIRIVEKVSLNSIMAIANTIDAKDAYTAGHSIRVAQCAEAFATLGNWEWGSIGNIYIKGLCTLASQGSFIMVGVGIFSALVASVVVAGNLHTASWSVAAYIVILCFCLFKTGFLAKSSMPIKKGYRIYRKENAYGNINSSAKRFEQHQDKGGNEPFVVGVC